MRKESLVEYKVEDVSPVKKKVSISIQPEEVTAAILGAVALYRNSVQIDGFRKGKVPTSIIEQRFHEKLYEEARQDLINVHINSVMQELSVSPLSGINVDGPATIERGKGYDYTIEFETLPVFDLPNYEGLEVEQEKVVIDQKEVQSVIDRLRRDKARFVPAEGDAPAVDGQVANVDFEAFDDGRPVPGIKAANFDLPLGEHQALDEFEALVKTIPAGSEGEGPISFPEDFLSKEVAGKTITMKVRVNAVKNVELPELDDEFARSMGVDSVEKLRQSLEKSYAQTRTSLVKGSAQKTLLDRLLKLVDFPLPETLVKIQQTTLLDDMAARLERQGRSLAALGKSEDELMAGFLPRAEELARSQVLLLSIAKKENLEVSDKEVQLQIYNECLRDGADFNQRREQYERSGLIFVLRDRMLADKAMDLIYSRAKVTEVEPKAADTEAEVGKD